VSGRRPYDIDASNGTAPILLVLLIVFVPASAVAGGVHRMGCSLLVSALNIIAAVLLFIAGVGSLVLTSSVGSLAGTLWQQLQPSEQRQSYGGNIGALETEMRDDMTAVGVVSIVGAVSGCLEASQGLPCAALDCDANRRHPLLLLLLPPPPCSASSLSSGSSLPCSRASSGLRSAGRS
jgi:hypothetical protein